MLTKIAKPSQAPQGAVELLLECHDRIRAFTALARRLADAAGASETEIAEAAARVRRYFVEALPLHAADEEESLVPRLRGRDPAVDRELLEMQREHAEHGELLDRVVALCSSLEEAPLRRTELAPALAAASDALREHFDAHLDREERVVFPAVRALAAEEQARVVAEIRGRRHGR